MEDRIYMGTEAKVVLTPVAEGFDPDENEWWVDVRYGSGNKLFKTYTKSDMVKSDGMWCIIVDTLTMSGDVRAIITAEIPDDDCDDGLRREVTVVRLFNVKRP